MTQEEKARAYDEALERARAMHDVNYTDSYTKANLEEIFPELRESEDERIRKSIVATIEQCPDDFLNPKNRDRMLEWLEKQKEHHIPWYDYQKSKEAGYTIVPNEEYERLIKQKEQEPQVFCEAKAYDLGYKQGKEDAIKEQKPAEKQDYSGLNDLERAILRGFLCAGVENVPVGIIKDTAYECMGFLALIEPNPAEWSEEDDTTIKSAVHWLEKYLSTIRAKDVSSATQEGILTVKVTITNLKSLRPQPKQEWSEEDEKIMQTMIREGDLKPSEIGWLISLRPRPQYRDTYYDIVHNILDMLKDMDFMKITPEHRVSLLNDIRVKCKNADECAAILDEPSWKPSKELMKALGASIVFHKNDPFVEKLWELYNQLQKL